MFEEHDRIVLTEDIAVAGLKAGDAGTIVHVHPGGEAFEVEFPAPDGGTAAIATAPAAMLRPVTASPPRPRTTTCRGRGAGPGAGKRR